jgi:hypothetical protein
MASSEGLILSFVTRVDSMRLGRVAPWHSKDGANREANRDHVVACVRALRVPSLATEEVLLEVKSGHVPQELTEFLAGDLDIELTARAPVEVEVA